jgi:beta-glucosidase
MRATILYKPGKAEPSALLPMQIPENMRVVEKQAEDVPFDMKSFKDSEGNIYDFAFGMDWKGVIDDERVNKYK